MAKSKHHSRDRLAKLEAQVSHLNSELQRFGTDASLEKELREAYARLVRGQAGKLKKMDTLQRKNEKEIASRKERMAITVHDLKVPLTVSLLNLEFANMEPDNVEKQNYLTGVRRELEFLLDTISNLLDLEQQETIQINPQEVDLKEMLESILERMSVFISDKPDLKFSTAFPKRLLPVQADRQKLTRVFNNLLSNAIKYTEEGTIKVSVEIDKDKNRVTIAIEDSGGGIEPDRLPHIFKMFEGDNSRLDSSGVGLAFVKMAVEAHGGGVSLSSRKGEGTCVRVMLNSGKD